METLDYIFCIVSVAIYLAGVCLSAKMLVNRFDRELAEHRVMIEDACERIYNKVDELEDFMSNKVEKITVRHTEELNDLLEKRGL